MTKLTSITQLLGSKEWVSTRWTEPQLLYSRYQELFVLRGTDRQLLLVQVVTEDLDGDPLVRQKLVHTLRPPQDYLHIVCNKHTKYYH